MFYHLSSDANLTEIVPASAALKAGQICPRIPKQSFCEDKTPRVCISPTVWQCILSKPEKSDEELLFIYKVCIEQPSYPKGFIADSEITDEKWITDEDLVENGEILKLERMGKVVSTKRVREELKSRNKRGELPRDENERKYVWTVDDDVWKLREECWNFRC